MMDKFHEITVEEIAEARRFFETSSQSTLISTATRINMEQPFFTAAATAWTKLNIPQIAVDELLQSIFEVYYVVAIMREEKVRSIDISDIEKNANLFGEFSRFYKHDDYLKSNHRILETAYFKNPAVFEHCIDSMYRALGDVKSILDHCESLVIYHALLRAIEVAK